MKNLIKVTLFTVGVAALWLGTNQVQAQQQGGRGQRFDPAQMRERQMEFVKTTLEAKDDEWKVIQPLLEDVLAKRMSASSSRFGGFGMMPRGNRQGDQAGQGDQGRQSNRPAIGGRETPPEMNALRTALESKTTPTSEIKAKLTAYRDAQKKRTTDLETARAKLREVLTLRQEAQLVLLGYLD